MVAKVQIKRTSTPNSPPAGLQPGELSVEMADPVRLWVGVPAIIDPTQRKLLVDLSTGTGITASVIISQTPPAGAVSGTLWWESDSGLLYLAYDDGNTIQWVMAAPQSAGGSGGGGVDPGTFVLKSGDTMTGPLTLSADPTAPMGAATKQYVDAHAGGGGGFPAGTVLLFMMAAPPVGWTKVLTAHDRVLRIVNTAGGGTGGTVTFGAWAAGSSTGNLTLTEAMIASHQHWFGQGVVTSGGTYWMDLNHNPGNQVFHGAYVNFAGGNGPHSHPLNNNLQFVDVIAASKD